MVEDTLDKQATSPEGSGDGAKGLSRVYDILLPPDMAVWRETHRLASKKDTRVEDIALCASQDPVHVIELIKVANALFFSGGKSPITSTKTAIVRLGYDVVLETLDKLKDRPLIDNPDISHWMEIHRSRCKRTSILARMLAETSARTLADDLQVSGILLNIGDMLAVSYFKDHYVELAEDLSRSSVVFRLAQDFKFDQEYMGLNYLRRQGIPEALLFALDREGRSRSQERAIMKPLSSAAGELVDAFDSNRWDKYAPGKTLPSKSSIRMLQLSDPQYLRLYEKGSEYLFAIKALEDKKKQDELNAQIAAQTAAEKTKEEPIPFEESGLQDEIQSLLSTPAPTVKPSTSSIPSPQIAKPASTTAKRTNVTTISESLGNDFSLGKATPGTKIVARVRASEPLVAPPQVQTMRGGHIVSSITDSFADAATAEELLTKLLQQLVDDGPFEKSALIVVSKDRKKAIVVAARGPDIGNGQKLELEDPLSPLAQCFSKVQSFGNRSSSTSPWGSKAFALSPIDADHDTPVALYADCGIDGSITFEARRVFRVVVELLNQKLPQIPGGIPVEL